MNKQPPMLEWHVAESDTEWESLCKEHRSGVTSVVQQYHRYLLTGIVLALFLAGAAVKWQANLLAQHQLAETVRTTIQSADPGANPEVTLVAVRENQLVAEVVVYDQEGAPAYRQTQVYQRTAGSWQQSAVTMELWGPVQRLESSYFGFVFHQHDAQAVHAAAPRIDALYEEMRRNMGLLPQPEGDRRVIEVSVTHPPGHALYTLDPDKVLTISSPVLYRAPVELSDADLLVQDVALALSTQLSPELYHHYAIWPTWHPLLNAVQLWQLWDLDLPLAAWRADLVHWIYFDVPATQANGPVILSPRYQEMCAAHQLWLPAPTYLYIPLACNEALDHERFRLSLYVRSPPRHLSQLGVPAPELSYPEQSSYSYYYNYIGQTVAQATLIDYAVRTYGQERLPVLLGALDHTATWESVIPEVFGVPAAEFEAGWQAYLATFEGQ